MPGISVMYHCDSFNICLLTPGIYHDRSKREVVLIETRIEQIRGDCGVSVYCNGRFKGVWLCRDRAYDWVPPSFLHAICRAPNANAAVEHTLLWLEA